MTLTALNAARLRHQAARETLRPGTVTIGGVNYKAGITLLAVKPEIDPDGAGAIYVQRGEVTIRKTLLPSCPPRGTLVTINGTDFTIADNGGQMEHAVAWVLRLMRLPPTA